MLRGKQNLCKYKNISINAPGFLSDLILGIFTHCSLQYAASSTLFLGCIHVQLVYNLSTDVQ